MVFPGHLAYDDAAPRVTLSPGLRLIAALLLAMTAVALAAPSASAHTALDTSDPADGSTVTEAVEQVVLTYTLPVTTVGNSVMLVGPDGSIEVEVTQEGEGEIVVATPTTPLEDGDYTVDWVVAAQDGHLLDGTFGFSVEGVTPEASQSPTPSVTAQASASPSASSSPSPMPSATMDGMDGMEVPTVADGPLTTIVTRAGATAALWALLVGAGALVFAWLAMRDEDPEDVARVIAGVRWSGALLLGGLMLRLFGRSSEIAAGSAAETITMDSVSAALAGTTLWVFVLQAVGGALMLLGAWRSPSGSWAAAIGVLLAGAGHVLGGHSNTAEPRWLVITADVAHLAAAAVWVGGVVTLVSVLRSRRRDGRPLHAAAMTSRFGAVAAGSFVVVGAAGVALTWAIVDEPSELWATAWGITLLVKVALVVVVAVLGAYLHFRVVPHLAARAAEAALTAPADPTAPEWDAVLPDTDADARHLHRAVTWEAVLFTLVVVATAVLVAASTHA